MASTPHDLGDGAVAMLRDPGTLTVGQKRPLEILINTLGRKRFMAVVNATELATVPEDADDAVRDAAIEASADAMEALALTEAEWGLMARMTDATLFALLDSWTGVTGADGQPVPPPASIEDIVDIPDTAYQQLAQVTGALYAEHMKRNGFGPDSVENPASPTGAFEGSDRPSEADQAMGWATTEPVPSNGGGSTAIDGSSAA